MKHDGGRLAPVDMIAVGQGERRYARRCVFKRPVGTVRHPADPMFGRDRLQRGGKGRTVPGKIGKHDDRGPCLGDAGDRH